jgi:putative peptidoglycan lipid II flippase
VKFTVSNSIANASILLIIFSFISRITGFIRESVIANHYGLSNSYDIYLISSVLPITINTIILFMGQNFLIPKFVTYRNTNQFDLFTRKSILIFFVFGTLIAVALFFSVQTIIYWFEPTNLVNFTHAENILKLVLLTIPATSVISVLSALLQSEKKYIVPAVSTLFLNVLMILMIVIFNKEIGIYAIAIGYLIGTIFQMIVLLFRIDFVKIFFHNTKNATKDSYSFLSPTLIMIFLIESIGQLYVLSDRFFYNNIRSGGIAAINYAQFIFALPISIVIQSISLAIFPKFSEDFNANNTNGIIKSFNSAIEFVLLVFIPISFAYHFLGNEIISLFYQHGMFGEEETRITQKVLSTFNLGLIAYAIYSVINKVIYSSNLVFYLFIITVLGIILKVFSNIILVRYFDYLALPMGTVISYIFFLISSIILLYKKVKLPWIKKNLQRFLLLSINGFLAILLTIIIIRICNIDKFELFISRLFTFGLIFILNLFVIRYSTILDVVSLIKQLRK